MKKLNLAYLSLSHSLNVHADGKFGVLTME